MSDEREDRASEVSAEFLEAVAAEVEQARAKFPRNAHMLAALTEEVGEVARALLGETPERLRAECVQVAAVAMRLATEGDADFEVCDMLEETALLQSPGAETAKPAANSGTSEAERCGTCDDHKTIRVETGTGEDNYRPCPDCSEPNPEGEDGK